MIRWGIIGCGDVTEIKSGPAFQKAAGSALVAVMRRTPGLAEDYARRHGVPRWTTDADALIADPQVDAVYVATPPGTHAAYALRVCRAGKPCYVEKPMARHAPEAQAMVDAFRAARLPLFVAYYRRALPRFQAVAALVASGRIGTLTAVRFELSRVPVTRPQALWRLDAAQAGGGLFVDMACHVLDLIDPIAGPVTITDAAARRHAGGAYAVEDQVTLQFHTVSGVTGSGVCDFAANAEADDLCFEGTEGRIRVAVFGEGPIRIETAAGCEEQRVPHPAHVQQPLIESIVAQLHGGPDCPSTGESALRTTHVIDRALADYYGGREDAFWERPQTWPGRKR